MTPLSDDGGDEFAVPADLLAALAVVLVADALVLVVAAAVPRTVIGLLLALFVPGYVVVAALFPGRSRRPARPAATTKGPLPGGGDGLTGGERAALSFGVSLALLPIVGLALSAVPGGYTPLRATAALSAVSVVGAAAAWLRRRRLPPDERFAVPVRNWVGAALDRSGGGGASVDTAVNAVLVVSVLVAVSTMAYAVAAPSDGEQFTSFALVGGEDGNSALAGSFPDELDRAETAQLTAVVTNHEGDQESYAVVVELQRVRTGDDRVTVLAERELERGAATVRPGETWRFDHVVAPEMTGEDLRLAYYLYRGDAPADAATDSAYRRLHLWIDVTPVGGANESAAATDSSAANESAATDSGAGNESATVPVPPAAAGD